jgi:hypothetical protein
MRLVTSVGDALAFAIGLLVRRARGSTAERFSSP